MTDPEVLAEVDRLVEEAAAEEPERVWTAVRLGRSNTGTQVAVAFMGTFRSKEAAMERCSRNVSKLGVLEWKPVGLFGEARNRFETPEVHGQNYAYRFYIAEQEIQG